MYRDAIAMRKIRQALELQCHCHGAPRSECQTGARVSSNCRVQRESESAPPRSGAWPEDSRRLWSRTFAGRTRMHRSGSTSARASGLRPWPFERGMWAGMAMRRASSTQSARPGRTQPKTPVGGATRGSNPQGVADRPAFAESADRRSRPARTQQKYFRPEKLPARPTKLKEPRRVIGAVSRTAIPASSRSRAPRPPIATAAPTPATARAGRF